AYIRIIEQIPDTRLNVLSADLNDLIAKAKKPSWFHQRINHTNSERERFIRAAVKAAQTGAALKRLAEENALNSREAGPQQSSADLSLTAKKPNQSFQISENENEIRRAKKRNKRQQWLRRKIRAELKLLRHWRE